MNNPDVIQSYNAENNKLNRNQYDHYTDQSRPQPFQGYGHSLQGPPSRQLNHPYRVPQPTHSYSAASLMPSSSSPLTANYPNFQTPRLSINSDRSSIYSHNYSSDNHNVTTTESKSNVNSDTNSRISSKNNNNAIDCANSSNNNHSTSTRGNTNTSANEDKIEAEQTRSKPNETVFKKKRCSKAWPSHKK